MFSKLLYMSLLKAVYIQPTSTYILLYNVYIIVKGCIPTAYIYILLYNVYVIVKGCIHTAFIHITV